MNIYHVWSIVDCVVVWLFKENLLIYATKYFLLTLAPINMMIFWLGCIYVCFSGSLKPYLINFFKNKINCPFNLSTFSLHVPRNIIRNHLAFVALHHATASPSARCVMASNAVCRLTDIFSPNNISFKYLNRSSASYLQF